MKEKALCAWSIVEFVNSLYYDDIFYIGKNKDEYVEHLAR